ncbi:MBL fold metallo-hydrolase [Brevibacillus fluminis]|uniref:MBL fold metallo-hydrolase n=1 Tax=Brevibacillus fluminis TaxID=511487 RepID=A0A3M8DTW8_9BACL|nr:MBL fold metallo-hydrolase [Brevibacillus fluminis]RNB90417.1 MBL fold metallo-hydrolase [Brevibacillus fluminis]
MNIQKLPWAGIRLESATTAVVIDPLYHFPGHFGQPHEPLSPLDAFGSVDAILITHHHSDHFDPKAIALFYGDDIPVYMPAESLELIQPGKLKNIRGVNRGESIQLGDMTVTATYSVDGVGDPQVAWIVQSGQKKAIHCGDTLWHGYWWSIARSFGPFDVACLPVNGAVVELSGLTPSGQPISMNPEQAIAAANILGVTQLIPIHYGLIHHPPVYRQTPELLERLQAAAGEEVNVRFLHTGERINI